MIGILEIIAGIIMFIGGIALNYIINRRRFNRGGGFAGSAQWFNSYESYLLLSFVERIGKIIAVLLIVFGLAFIGWGCETNNIKVS